MNKTAEFFLALSAIVVFVVILGILYNFESIDREITRWKQLAETSQDSAEIYHSLSTAEQSLVRWGMDDGFAGIFKTRENDMTWKIAQLQLLKEKAERLSMIPGNSPEYSSTVKLLQEELKTLDLKAINYWNTHTGVGWWLAGGLFLYLGLFSFAHWNKDRSSFT
ncbi:hypothetical protein A3K01_04065 [candidate division WWE3 bacterium RIFOXYD1_FULL_43_17]|uniref:Uncharacterized protein n=3 Tax=Katanobacteria TaxID=422282 RepID=A0A1F4XFG7_UNCKA|nr:MAG: hypothetical protein UU59_C0028G0005 [candidate division WWE3 bacterium GW2011_GWE1_41_27]KKS60054.1 MAG: hypothetical protein UV26_C0010G0007 [candidate division WWE3 bacterium GW2011_GWF2_42_42]OGC79873.1 MAG: hypothetical protein A3K01_04065 [candidate division WWE3 bacterium RIFOXYD1_FULL_43_17]